MNNPSPGTQSQTKNHDPHVAEVEYKTKTKSVMRKTVAVPAKLHGCVLLQCMIRFLQEKTAEGTDNLYVFALAIENFILYLNTNFNDTKSIPNTIMKSYSLHLNTEEMKIPKSVRANLSCFNTTLRWIIEKSWFSELQEKDRVFILAVYANRPSIPKNSMLDGTAPAMSDLVDAQEYDDRDLLDSLIRFCFGFLKIYKKHRNLILSNRRVQARIEQVKASDSPEIDWRFLHPDLDNYDEIFNAIVGSRDKTLIERLLLSNEHFQNVFMSSQHPHNLEELYAKLKICVRNVGSLTFSHILSESVQYITFEQLDIRCLLNPSKAEEMCLMWLLGIDRIQQSGQQKLTFEDFDLTPTHVTISFQKDRSSERARESTTHKRKTLNYEIISETLKLRKHFEQDFPTSSFGRNAFFQYNNLFSPRQTLTSYTHRPIVFACTPGNNFYEEIGTMFPKAKLFQEYFRLLVDENTVGDREAKKLRRSAGKNNQKLATGEPLTRSLTANIVAHSRAIIDPEKPVPTSAFDRRAKEEAAADGAAHSVRTSKEVYKNRSQTPHRLGQRVKFVETVGKLQEEDARKVSSWFDNTQIISLQDVNDLLGWDVSNFKPKDLDDFNRLVDSAEADGYNCAPFGWLSKPMSMERIIIVTPITAALILSFIKGCQIELKKSIPQARGLAIVLQLSYAKLVLNAFDHRTVADGREILEEYEFPPAII